MTKLNTQVGRVRYTAGRIFETRSGPRVNVVFDLDDGTEIKIWGDPSNETLKALRRGEEVPLMLIDGKWKLGGAPQPAPQQDLFGELLRLQEMVASIIVQLEQINSKLDSRLEDF